MGNGLSLELQALVRAAAGPIEAGESIKAQMRRSHAALGRPPWWRVRGAWYGEAGKWTAAAVEDFRARMRALEAKRKRRDAESQSEVAGQLARLDRLRAALTVADADFYKLEIEALGGVAEWFGHRYRRDRSGQ